jgi:hypothetical protein
MRDRGASSGILLGGFFNFAGSCSVLVLPLCIRSAIQLVVMVVVAVGFFSLRGSWWDVTATITLLSTVGTRTKVS